jgi:hypothetical protein
MEKLYEGNKGGPHRKRHYGGLAQPLIEAGVISSLLSIALRLSIMLFLSTLEKSMSDIAQKRRLRRAALVAVVIPAALLAGCAAPAPPPPPPQPVYTPAPPAPQPRLPAVRG